MLPLTTIEMSHHRPQPNPINTDTTAAAQEQKQQSQQQAHHPFLRHQPDPIRGAGKLLPSDYAHYIGLMGGMKDEREVVVPPAAQEATARPPPACPKNARFSFCAVEPVRVDIGD